MKLEKVDVEILKILEKDGRASFRDIAKKVGVTTPTVSNKVSMYEQMGIIKGFSVNVDTEALGEISILLSVKCKPSDVPKTAEKLKEAEEVREVYIVGGSWIWAKVTLIDNTHLNQFISELTKMEKILDYEYKTIVSTIKEESRAVLSEGVNAVLSCFYCRKPMHDKPVKLKMDGKDHFVCCNTCAKEYKIKYEKLKEGI
ncbi:MAG: winged helix-turn-helix transcriptional regulator [Thermoplasmata archaeon]|nr:MAG: winged helix-turn-helix transcriptional regulator [Thermoplasmata archaeon]